jgi:phosphoglycerate dehydrogenase-like enzyme
MIAVGSVDKSMAEATVGWMLTMTHNVLQKNALVAEGRWNDRSGLMGVELRDRTFGAVGFGGIAQATVR